MGQRKQRLRRIEDFSGSSAGWWGVQEWPGLIVARIDRHWRFYFHPQELPTDTYPGIKSLLRTEALYHNYHLDRQRYPTRVQALQALWVLTDSALVA